MLFMARVKSEPDCGPKTGFFGGMFNPIHFGHLLSVQQIAEKLELEQVLFVPTANPPHRSRPEVPAKIRLEMTRRAVANNPLFEVCELEINDNTKSYTVETVEKLLQNKPELKLFLLVGTDELAEFDTWERWNDLLHLATVVGMKRPGFDIQNIDEIIRKKCRIVDIPELEISSSEIRRKCKNGESIRYRLPEKVRQFILKHNLYIEN
ncbi:MAG: nicotinate-nucleotide adenylyltransferase [bacterium]